VRVSLAARLVPALAVVLLATCAGGLATSTPTPEPLAVPELKYRVIDELGRPWFCDPDLYPVAREDERVLAQQRFPEIQQDPLLFRTILARLNLPATGSYTVDQQLAVYREWKTLRAFELQAVGDVWGFAYLAQKSGDTGERVDGRITAHGRVTVLSRTSSGPPPCPICLAVRTRIATPRGDIAVEQLRRGDLVWTLNARGARVAAPLIAVGRTPVPATHEVVRLALADGRVVLASPGHPTADGRRVGELVVGDALDGARIASSERVAYDGGATYDLLPAGVTGAYWASGVLLASTLRAL
jgi:Hint domain